MSRMQTIAAIDVGTEKVCTVIVAVSPETGRINVIGVSSTPSSGLKKSQVVDLEEAIQAISNSVEAAERMAGGSIDSAYVSTSGIHINSQNSKGVVAVSEPEGEIVPEDVERVIEAARAVSLPNSREILHVIPRYFVVDSQEDIKDPVGMAGVRLEAETHIITAASITTRNLARCLSETGIKVDQLVFAGLASSYSTVTDTERELGVVLIDIGAGTTSICVYVEGALAHSAVLPVGGKNITNDLAVGMKISLQSAEKIKCYLSQPAPEIVLPQSGDENRKDRNERRRRDDQLDLSSLNLEEDIRLASRKFLVEGIIKPRLNEIFQMVGKELQTAGYAGATPAGVVLTGGGAQTIGVVDSSKRVLSMPSRMSSPKGLSGLVDELENPMFATSVGLILYGQQLQDDRGFRPTLSKLDIGNPFAKLSLGGLVTKIKELFTSFLP